MDGGRSGIPFGSKFSEACSCVTEETPKQFAMEQEKLVVSLSIVYAAEITARALQLPLNNIYGLFQ